MSEVGATFKAQKAQSFKNCIRGGPFGLFENPVCCKISEKIGGGAHWRHFEKKSHKAEKRAGKFISHFKLNSNVTHPIEMLS